MWYYLVKFSIFIFFGLVSFKFLYRVEGVYYIVICCVRVLEIVSIFIIGRVDRLIWINTDFKVLCSS